MLSYRQLAQPSRKQLPKSCTVSYHMTIPLVLDTALKIVFEVMSWLVSVVTSICTDNDAFVRNLHTSR